MWNEAIDCLKQKARPRLTISSLSSWHLQLSFPFLQARDSRVLQEYPTSLLSINNEKIDFCLRANVIVLNSDTFIAYAKRCGKFANNDRVRKVWTVEEGCVSLSFGEQYFGSRAYLHRDCPAPPSQLPNLRG